MADDPINLTLTSNDILGIIQRSLMELHSYCGQPPHNVDPQVCMQVLERTASFVGRLVQPIAAGNDQGEAPRGRAN